MHNLQHDVIMYSSKFHVCCWQPFWLPDFGASCNLCDHCSADEVETKMHFLLRCEAFEEIRENYFTKFSSKITNFSYLNDTDKFKIVLGEGDHAYLAAQYILACHTLRDSE